MVTVFELDKYMEAVFVSSAGLNPAVDSNLVDLDNGMFSEYRVVSHGLSWDSESLYVKSSFWRVVSSLHDTDYVDIWGLSFVTGEWRVVAEYQPNLEFPLVVRQDLLETPVFRDLLFAFQADFYGELYVSGQYQPRLLDLTSKEDLDLVISCNDALMRGRGVVSPDSCIPGLFGRFTNESGSIVGGPLTRPELVVLD